MLVEFSVSNFKSIADKVTFSANASNSSSKRKEISKETYNSLAPHTLNSAVIFGPNASGKSALIDAVQFFRALVVDSATRFTAGDKIPFPQNLLASDLSGKPSEFEAVFIYDNELYQYGFCVDNNKIHEEWLYARASKHLGKTRDLFHRELVSDSQDQYSWNINEGQVPGEKESWKKATRPNALFLSTAVQLNSETLRKPFEWIRDFLHVIGSNERIDDSYTASLLQDSDMASKIEEFIASFDLHIDGFRIESKPTPVPVRAKEILSEDAYKRLSKDMEGAIEFTVFTKHEADNGDFIEIELPNESDGTQALFGLAGPIFDVLQNGYTLFVDELSNSLHPHALRGLVGLFHDTTINEKGAQLIFTSHETSIMAKNFMHKDQIWFVDRPRNSPTKLTPMSDFKVREVEAFQRSYLGGKYGALPNVGRIGHGLAK